MGCGENCPDEVESFLDQTLLIYAKEGEKKNHCWEGPGLLHFGSAG